jgi:hypothetical protein
VIPEVKIGDVRDSHVAAASRCSISACRRSSLSMRECLHA